MEPLILRPSDVPQVDQHQPSLPNGFIDHRRPIVPPEADFISDDSSEPNFLSMFVDNSKPHV